MERVGSDFFVYYTAAHLLRDNMNVHIYDGAEDKKNPVYVQADPDTVFAQRAKSDGISRVSLYIYPPTLADLLIPVTHLSAAHAFVLWSALNLAMILSVSVMLNEILRIHQFGLGMLVAIASLMFRPTVSCLYLGQVPILLLFLLMAGWSLVRRGHICMSGLLFALSAAIKLTPLIVIVPFLAWRNWKVVRVIILWGLAFFALLCVFNGWGVMKLWMFHVLPSMSSGISSPASRTLTALFYACWRGFDYSNVPVGLAWTVRVVSVLLLCYVAWLSRKNSDSNSQDSVKFRIFAVFLLLSCCLAPVSWVHAYVLSIPVLVILGRRVLEGSSSNLETTLLLLFVLSLSTNRIAYLDVAAPVLGVLLGVMELHKLHSEQSDEGVVNAVS
jgi:hypothetical protein